MPTATIPDEVRDVLANAQVDGTHVLLVGQLDRMLYSRTNKVLEALGGRWNRAAKAHVFDSDPVPLLEAATLTGEYSKSPSERSTFDVFYTPPALVERVIAMAGIEPGMEVLEPSAGGGYLAVPAARAGARVTAYELRPMALWPEAAGLDVSLLCATDFLQVPVVPSYDRVVMNPPFSRQQDMAHVLHAYDFLRPDGRLVAIMSPAFRFRSSGIAEQFRALVEDHGRVVDNPAGSFRSAGTNVQTVTVVLERPS